MARALKILHFLIILSMQQLALAEDEDQFIFNGFHGESNLKVDGNAKIHSSGILQLTNTSKQASGHAFYRLPLKFNSSSSGLHKDLSFSTNFVVAMVPELPNLSGHGMAFVISPSMDFSKAMVSEFLGLFNTFNNRISSNHVFAVELDTIKSPDMEDINDNHVGIDVNSLISIASSPVTYYSEGKNKSLKLINGHPIQVWIDYDDMEKLLNVTLAPTNIPKPSLPLLSTPINLSSLLLDYMYVGFSAATGAMASNHYVLGWSFNKSGQSQSLEISELPSVPRQKKPWKKLGVTVTILIVTVAVLGISAGVAVYFIRRKGYKETREDWEEEYGPQRFSYKDLYKATKGFNEKELLGSGGFGKVYRGLLPNSSNEQIAVKRISQCSGQGFKEFVAEIVSMGRLRHRNLVQLLGYCRRRGELLLVYDYMPNGSLDKFLFSNEKPNLTWFQRFQILKDIASALVYLHEEWEQVVLHRDVKASNVMLDADMNGRLGDFGLAKFHDRGSNPQTTHVVGTIGYLAPELARTGKATTSSDVFAFGAFMLEMACGRKPIELQGLAEEIILVDWVSENLRRGSILEVRDPRLEGDYVVEEMELVLKLGLLCSHSKPAVRPSIRQVMQYLTGDTNLPEIPPDSDNASIGMLSDNSMSSMLVVGSLQEKESDRSYSEGSSLATVFPESV